MPALAAQAEFYLMNDTMTEEANPLTGHSEQLQSEFRLLYRSDAAD